MRFLLIAILSFSFISLQAVSDTILTSSNQNFSIKVSHFNLGDQIKDGKICVDKIDGKGDTLKYCWSFNNVSQKDSIVYNVAEGVPYELKVFSSSGDSIYVSNVIETESKSEGINAFMTPIVEFITEIFFWDPFSAIGIYDPVVRNSSGNPVLHPNGEIKKQPIPFLVVWLILGALFFSFRTKFINITGLKYSIGLVSGKHEDQKSSGEVSHFQALTTALSATVGLGNIAGVAIAIVTGGAGAVFWIIIAGFLGMASKFVECTLGVKYRVIRNGVVSGGPMYYLSEGLRRRNKKWLGKILAGLFAVLCVGGSFGGGNMFQSNQAFAQIKNNFQGYEGGGFYFGIVMAVLVGIVIVGGIKKIAKVTDKIVPFMCLLYVLSALVIIVMNFGEVGNAFERIYNGAFSPDALKGGVIGVLIIGFQRAAFSNEAGVGSASIAHSAVKTDKPVTEGLVGLLEPLIDTVIVCTLTALVIIFTGFDVAGPGDKNGAEITTLAFESFIPNASWVLLVAIILFAFSTMISWSYYGLKSWEYLFGYSKFSEYSYKILFLIFVVVGASMDLGAVIEFSDLMILGMAFPNIIGLFILLPEVLEELKVYISDIKSKTK